MNKTVSVSIGGFAFVLDEEAYRRLQQYIEKVRLNLGSSPDTEEIISDVEGRLAELLTEYLKAAGRHVIDSSMVVKAISVMGAPEDFNVTGEPVNEKPGSETEIKSTHRVLYRDTEDRYLGGVCAGIAHYLGWDPIAVRLIFLALLLGFGSGVIVYIIMWILVPTAKTTAEKLRMRGKPVNLESIKERFESFGDEVKEFGRNIKENKGRWKSKGTQFGKRVEDSIYELGRVFSSAVGIFALLMGALLCFWLFTQFVTLQLFPGGADDFTALILKDPSLVFEKSSDFSFLYWGIFTVILLSIISLFRLGIRLLFRIPLKNRWLNITTTIVMLFAIASTVYGAVNLGTQFREDEAVMQVNHFAAPDSIPDTLYIAVDRDTEFSDQLLADEGDYESLIKVKGQKLIFGYPQFDIRRSESATARLEVKRSSNGAGRIEAIRNAENIFYPVEITGDTIRLKPVFTTPLADKFRAQQVNARLFVPTGTVIFLNEGSFRTLSLGASETNDSIWYGSPHSAKAFIMDKNGLRVL